MLIAWALLIALKAQITENGEDIRAIVADKDKKYGHSTATGYDWDKKTPRKIR